ncbi:hypothetical protein SAMN05421736_103341 [Evansella caseinilytica]|uniref:Cytochrome c oxidase subunit IIa family protein n=1 Tax=Evansella caseinilytica TaxID=1503961 RepID=A0A1H3MUM1_9BACI|nr:hypothetical protein [Evansella caseinilytica]SDY80184.1 hypothetical protein SAMN05421736_103341 [Evansella caseinilytica]
MEQRKVRLEEKNVEKRKAPVGTWFSLSIVAAIILGTYLLMFWFYMDRV